jgi:ABC-2 type transport system permease protein
MWLEEIMNKSFLIFKHEFLHKIRSTGFLILTLSIPLAALVGIGIFKLAKVFFEGQDQSIPTIGYVDQVGIFDDHQDIGNTQLLPYSSRDEANQALAMDEVREFFIIPDDYLSRGVIERYTLENEATTSPSTTNLIWSFLTSNLLDEKIPPERIDLIISPLIVKVTWVTEEGEIALQENNQANIIIPGVFALLMSFALMTGTNSLVSGLGEEKESRLIEVLFSSVSIRQMLVSKVLALGLAGLIQVAVWLISFPSLLDLASSSFGNFFQAIQIPADFIILGIVYFVLGYLLFASFSIGVGAISSNATEANALAMFYVMASFIPLWFLGLQVAYKNNPIWIILGIFPLTAPIQSMVRLGIAELPLWQLATSIAVLILSIIASLYLAIRIFRVYMLMYGKRPALRDLVRSLNVS